jgi:hypothetical protein
MSDPTIEPGDGDEYDIVPDGVPADGDSPGADLGDGSIPEDADINADDGP